MAAAAPLTTREAKRSDVQSTSFRVLGAISFCHLVNDMVQSLIPSLYPILKAAYQLDFAQVGLITLAYQATSSLLQPVVGFYTDRKPQPYSLAFGMTLTLTGLLLLGWANSFSNLLIAAVMVGLGSAIFHPESSRVARLASGGRQGLAQSFFQVGGNSGSALGPLAAALFVLPRGQSSVAWFSIAAIAGIALLIRIGGWSKRFAVQRAAALPIVKVRPVLTKPRLVATIAILLALIFSKYFYLACLASYYTFFLIERFRLPVQDAQLYLFLFLGSLAAGTIAGGPIGDRVGRKRVIWWSILGVLPFTLILPHANLFWTAALSAIIGLILASAFAAILVYAQELLPGNVGMVSGLFFGFAFGMAGIGAALLGRLADLTSLHFVFELCAFLPAIGLLAAFLPEFVERKQRQN